MRDGWFAGFAVAVALGISLLDEAALVRASSAPLLVEWLAVGSESGVTTKLPDRGPRNLGARCGD